MRPSALILAATLFPFAASAQAPPPLAWDFDGRAVVGEVQVMPVIVQADTPDALTTWIGAELPADRRALRHRREAMVQEMPQAVAHALPGAINGTVGPAWGGEFTVGRLPFGARRRIGQAMGQSTLSPTLSDLAVTEDRAGTLFVWVESIDASPITAESFPGDIVQTDAGPVVVDHRSEPYRVRMRIGTALMAHDGEVVVRYADVFEAVLDESGPDVTGRVLARQLARELATVWPVDPLLRDRFAQR